MLLDDPSDFPAGAEANLSEVCSKPIKTAVSLASLSGTQCIDYPIVIEAKPEKADL